MDNEREVTTSKSEKDHFSQSRANRGKMNELRSKGNALKNERNALTDSVKKLKVERDALNKELKVKIELFKKLVPPRKKTTKEVKHVNVAFIEKEIKAMEYKIETEGLSFDKEQKLMKIINAKKKELRESGAHQILSDEARDLSKEISELRAKADAAHKEITSKAAESQKKHEEIISLSNQFKELDVKQRELDALCKEDKEKYNEREAKRKEQRDVAHERPENHQRREEGHNRRERPRKDQKKEHHKPHVNLEVMQHKAEEKLKKGGKLTAEDLLAFQNKK